MRLLNPLQWNFGPRTTATLLTWAILPALLSLYTVWQGFLDGAANLGLTQDQVSAIVNDVVRRVMIVAIPLLVVCLGASVLFSWVVVRPLWQLRKGMERIALGDLTQKPLPVKSRDEVGQITRCFNEMLDSLKSMVQEMAVTAGELDAAGSRLQRSAAETTKVVEALVEEIQQVRSTAEHQLEKTSAGARATTELREASEQVASAAESQAREVESAAHTVREVAQAIERVAASAGVVAEAAENTRAAAEDGGETVRQVIESMDRVRQRVLEASDEIRQLAESLSQVDEILALIGEIADQTDLLALNAAVEAARVGEHGRGFAVVAGEVRRLAERSRKAAGDIAVKVGRLRQGSRHVVETMEASTDEVERGVLLVQEAGQALDRILAAVADTQRQVESISAASEEISAASVQVVNATHNLSAIAEENAATSEQMLSGTVSVASMIEEIENGARQNFDHTDAMAAASKQVRGAVEQMVAFASRVTATSGKLRERVGRFRLAE